MATVKDVIERSYELQRLNASAEAGRRRIRNILNGGRGAVVELLGEKVKEQHLPAFNLVDSGLTRLAQKLGRRPDVKVDPRRDRDSTRERDRAAKRERIVESYDTNSRLELDLPQAARWLAGYGFCVWVIKGRTDGEGFRYPHAELRDPFDCYPGHWGPDQQPNEMAIVRRVDRAWLAGKFPQFAKDVKTRGMQTSSTPQINFQMQQSWESTGAGVTVLEYYNAEGTYMVVPETGTLLTFVPNPLQSGPRFVIAKRFSFDILQGGYDQVLGLMRMIAQMNMMAVIATQDATFRETNIIGEIESGKYRRGRNAENYFSPGTRIEKPGADVAFQTFQQIDRLERQLRIGANYNVIDDAISPNSFVTGQGLDRLGQGGDNNISEYQVSMRHALEMLDARRLEWDETMYAGIRKPLLAVTRGEKVAENYEPGADIAGDYRTRRVFGVMAGWDEPSKIVTGLQLLQGRIIDRRTMQENLSGLEELGQINERIDQDRAFDALMLVLEQRGSQGDPAALAALVEIAEKPKERNEILRKFFTPQEPQLQGGEQQFLAQQQGIADAAAGGPPESIATVLSRLESSGAAEGGVQTVGALQ